MKRLVVVFLLAGLGASTARAQAQEPNAVNNGNFSSANPMPYIVDAVQAYATVGEICEALRQVYGTYTEVSIT
jgi:methylmalonyl-CoA mutase N-terminal domain/subunit